MPRVNLFTYFPGKQPGISTAIGAFSGLSADALPASFTIEWAVERIILKPFYPKIVSGIK